MTPSDAKLYHCPCRRIGQNCLCHGCFPTKESDLDFVLLSALERFRRHLLAVPTGSDVCCVLRCPGGWVWSPVRRPDQKATVSALVTKFRDFVSAVGKFAIKGPLAPRLLVLLLHWKRTHTHIQSRTASWESGGENNSRPGLRSCEPPGFRRDVQVRKFHAADHGVNARVAPPHGFGSAASFCVFQPWVQEGTAPST